MMTPEPQSTPTSSLPYGQGWDETVEALSRWWKEGGNLVVLTGAGVSKESGIPTFRDAQTGMWAKYNPEDLATRAGFMRDPKLVWQWYDSRRNSVWTVEPNPGHVALAQWEKHLHQRPASMPKAILTLITQNIDNLHRRAGSQQVIELHGNIFRHHCLVCLHPATVPDTHDPESGPPRCEKCGEMVRPSVVWFGEMLDPQDLQSAFEAAQQADVMVVAGTSGVVYPAAGLPGEAKAAGAFVVEINPGVTDLTWIMDVSLKGPSGAILQGLTHSLADALAWDT